MKLEFAVDWLAVLSAFVGGLAVTFWLAAAHASPPSAWRLKWLAVTAAALSLSIGLLDWQRAALTTRPDADAPGRATVVSPRAEEKPHTFITEIAPQSVFQRSLPMTTARQETAVEAETLAPPRLRIPALGVDEPVVAIPIRAGEWDLSALGKSIGWLATTGAHPGDDLAMVFIGHMTLSAVERGPFAYLQDIEKGAEVIYSLAGIDYTYAVSQASRVKPEDVRQLYVPDPDSLLLVTCTDWDGAQRVYASRLLVRAVLVSQDEAQGASQ